MLPKTTSYASGRQYQNPNGSALEVFIARMLGFLRFFADLCGKSRACPVSHPACYRPYIARSSPSLFLGPSADESIGWFATSAGAGNSEGISRVRIVDGPATSNPRIFAFIGSPGEKNQHDGLLYLRSIEADILCVSLYPTVTRAHRP
jgi:hypothetical protein